MGRELENIDLTVAQRKEILSLLKRYLPNTEVWAYGSRVKFTAKPSSDMDMVVFASKEQSLAVANLKEAFEESSLPFRVDFFIWDEVPEQFHKNIEDERVVLQEKSETSDSPEGWEKRTLGDVIITNDDTHSKKDKWKFINYLDTGNLTENQISEVKYLVVSEDKIPSRAKRKVQPGDIVFSTVRPNQKHYGILKNPVENLLVSTGFVTIRAKKDAADTNFIYWFLVQPEIIERLQTIGEHSTSAYPSIKPSDIEGLNLNLPPLTEQKAIAHTLGSLDDKIELNRRMNETLEAMAQALFKSWFVDFDPVIDNALAAGNDIPAELKERADIRLSACRYAQAGEALGDLPAPRPGVFFVYAIQCDNASLYIGQTDDLKRRWNEHCHGRGADWTKKYKPLKVAHYEVLYSREEAVEREKELKTTGGRRWLNEQIESGRARQAGAHKPLPKEIQKLFPSEFEHTEEMGWVPKGWGVGYLSDVCFVKGGYAYKSKDFSYAGDCPVIKIKNINQNKTVNTSEVQFIPQGIADKTKNFWLSMGDLLMAMTGATVGKFGIFIQENGKTFLLNQRVAKFFPVKEFETVWFAYACINQEHIMGHIINVAHGSAQPNISADTIMATKIIKPDDALIWEFENSIIGNFNKIISNGARSKILSKLRDTLLPQLLSGEIRIPEAEKLAEDLDKNGGGNGKS